VRLRRERFEEARARLEKLAETSGRKDEGVEPPTEEEERLLLHLCECRLLEAASQMRFRREIAATAVVFLKRVFLRLSARDVDPFLVMWTCLFVAIKVEACPFREVGPYHARMYDWTQVAPEAIVEPEMSALLALRYELTVHHPFRAVRGLVEAARDWHRVHMKAGDLTVHGCVAVRDAALEVAMASLVTDAPLLYTPGHIAAASLLLATEHLLLPSSEDPAVRAAADSTRRFVLATLQLELSSTASSAPASSTPKDAVDGAIALLRPVLLPAHDPRARVVALTPLFEDASDTTAPPSSSSSSSSSSAAAAAAAADSEAATSHASHLRPCFGLAPLVSSEEVERIALALESTANPLSEEARGVRAAVILARIGVPATSSVGPREE
jgi:Cyclin, N-terminal domain